MAAALTEGMGDRTKEQNRPLHIFTLNVNGLEKNKSKELLNVLESLKVDVVFLTNTLIGENDTVETYKKDWTIFYTCSDSRSKGCLTSELKNGAAILLNKKRDFRCYPEIVDESGCYVIVSCWISGRLCTFVCVYHHGEERGLLKKLSEKIKPPYTDILVVGGNFNTALDKVKDSMSILNNSVHNRIRKELKLFIGEHDLIDAWREKNPDAEQYTYVKIPSSRLDYFFIDDDKLKLVQECKINEDNISDHRSVSLILRLKDQTRELKIFSSTVFHPRDEDLAKLCPDIILLAKGEANHEDYIKKLKREEERKEKKWNVVWSDHSNAAILVTERQRDIEILFTAYHQNYVILHCILLDMLHTFVSAYHPTEKNLKNMLREIMCNRSGRIVIGGDFRTSEQITELMKNEFKRPEGEYMQMHYFIHAPLGQANKIHPPIYFLNPNQSLSWEQWVQIQNWAVANTSGNQSPQ